MTKFGMFCWFFFGNCNDMQVLSYTFVVYDACSHNYKAVSILNTVSIYYPSDQCFYDNGSKIFIISYPIYILNLLSSLCNSVPVIENPKYIVIIIIH